MIKLEKPQSPTESTIPVPKWALEVLLQGHIKYMQSAWQDQEGPYINLADVKVDPYSQLMYCEAWLAMEKAWSRRR